MGSRFLILGGSGLLGRALLRHVPEGVEAVAPTRSELPLEEVGAVGLQVDSQEIAGVILSAAWTQVDACESDPERAFLVNGHLPGRLATALAIRRVPLTFLSTDYVFDGTGRRPYREYDRAAPQGVYGRSKWYGECAVRDAGGDHQIVRASGLYGPGGPDFVTAIRAKLAQGTVSVVRDQTVAPTRVDDLAPAIWKIARSSFRGVVHASAAGETTWFEFAVALAADLGYAADRVQPTTSAAFARPAPRPAYSILDNQRLRSEFGINLPNWNDGLSKRVAELRAERQRESGAGR